MLANRETSARCAFATLRVLAQELNDASCPPAEAERLRCLINAAQEHVTELLEPDYAEAPRSPVRQEDAGGSPRASVTAMSAADEASGAWRSASALRGATSEALIKLHRAGLQQILEQTRNERVRRLCLDALSARRG